MPYWGWLVGCSALVAALEAAFPWRAAQRQLRPRLWSDLLYLLFNGHFLGVAIYWVAITHIEPRLVQALGPAAPSAWLGVASAWPLWSQCLLVTVAMDFVQWCVHNLLHRVPWLWTFHKVHHSVVDGEMDWIVSFRFHWMEVVVYKSLQYLPLALLGVDGQAILFHAVFGTLIGHLNHANLDWDYGPLRFVLNNPRMHLWHHDYDAEAGHTRNFGIILSCWDYLFGTAVVPGRPPRAIGFPGVEQFPRSFFRAEIWPLWR